MKEHEEFKGALELKQIMAELFRNKYRTTSTRLQNWDYSSPATYFITICTKNHKNYFGTITNTSAGTKCIASLQTTEIGNIAKQEWFKTPEIRPDMNITLGEFVVMPNHIHGLLQIGIYNGDGYRDAKHHVPTSIPAFGPQSKNLGSVIRGYKSAVTTYARKQNIDFQWQSLYYESIIRTDASLNRISHYIKNNPIKWLQDKYNKND